MTYAKIEIPFDHAYLLPISDIHIGDKRCAYDELKANIEWVKNTPNAYVFLNGDILNVATRTSKSNPHEQNMDLGEQVKYATELFEPIKTRILGAIDGNHERRISDIAGYSPTTALCLALGIPYYQYSVVLNLVVGDRIPCGPAAQGRISSFIYFHHTTGGGGTVGGKINRIDKLRQLVCNCDAYIGSHNHQLGVLPVETRLVDFRHDRIIIIRQMLIDTGSYLKWDDGYAEAMQLQSSKIGSPRIRLDGKRKDIHASV